MNVSDYEYATMTITPASMTKRKRFANKRSVELSQIEQEGWEVVDIEPERIFRRGDKVTVKRPRQEPNPEPLNVRSGGIMGWWDSLTTNAQIGFGLIALAVVVSALAFLS